MDPTTPPLITSLVGIGGLAFAIYKAGKDTRQAQADRQADLQQARAVRREDILQSRADKLAEKRAEVAAETLIAALGFLDRLSSNAEAELVIPSDPKIDAITDPVERHRRTVERPWISPAIHLAGERFYKAEALAEAYLLDSVNDLLRQAWEEHERLRGAHLTFTITPLGTSKEAFGLGLAGSPKRASKRFAVLPEIS